MAYQAMRVLEIEINVWAKAAVSDNTGSHSEKQYPSHLLGFHLQAIKQYK